MKELNYIQVARSIKIPERQLPSLKVKKKERKKEPDPLQLAQSQRSELPLHSSSHSSAAQSLKCLLKELCSFPSCLVSVCLKSCSKNLSLLNRSPSVQAGFFPLFSGKEGQMITTPRDILQILNSYTTVLFFFLFFLTGLIFQRLNYCFYPFDFMMKGNSDTF